LFIINEGRFGAAEFRPLPAYILAAFKAFSSLASSSCDREATINLPPVYFISSSTLPFLFDISETPIFTTALH